MIHGYALEKVYKELGDGFVSESLVAPALALAFEFLKRTIKRADGSLIQEWLATHVRVGEPDPNLFVIPADYEILPRDVYYERALKARGRVADPLTLESFRMLEAGSSQLRP